MYEDLIIHLREYAKHYSDDSTYTEAADAIEKLEQENTFLKAMQRQFVTGIPMNDLGRMVEKGLKRTGVLR